MILDPAKLNETARQMYEHVRAEVNRGETSQKRAVVPWEQCAKDAKERWLIVAEWHMDQMAQQRIAVDLKNVEWTSYDQDRNPVDRG
jgi:hypothetical protein